MSDPRRSVELTIPAAKIEIKQVEPQESEIKANTFYVFLNKNEVRCKYITHDGQRINQELATHLPTGMLVNIRKAIIENDHLYITPDITKEISKACPLTAQSFVSDSQVTCPEIEEAMYLMKLVAIFKSNLNEETPEETATAVEGPLKKLTSQSDLMFDKIKEVRRLLETKKIARPSISQGFLSYFKRSSLVKDNKKMLQEELKSLSSQTEKLRSIIDSNRDHLKKLYPGRPLPPLFPRPSSISSTISKQLKRTFSFSKKDRF